VGIPEAYGKLCVSALLVGGRAQVEDVLKRSFAEAHAQKALPEQQKLLESGEEALRELAAAQPIT